MLPFTILLPGVPVTSDRGALGWCTVAYLALEGKRILFDTGSYGDRGVLLQRMDEVGLSPEQIDIVVVSHLHFDHFVNVDLFPQATILAPRRDLEYVLSGEYLHCKDPYVPIGLVRNMEDRLTPLEDGQSIAPGLSVIALPGHTPGIMGLYYEKDKILFASDAVKNAWEFQRNEPPVTFFSKAVALENYAHIREKARIIVPGHDRHFTLGPDNSIQYLSRCRTEIRSYMDPEKDEPVRQFV